MVWTNEHNSDSIKLEAIGKRTWYGYIFNDPDSALYFSQIELSYAEKAKSIKHQAHALNTIGAVYFLKSDYRRAVENYSKSLKLYKQVNDYEGIANCLNNLSGVYVTTESFEAAVKIMKESLTLFKETNNEEGIARAYGNLGTVYLHLGEKKSQEEKHSLMKMYYDSALTFLFIAKDLSRNHGDLVRVSNAENNIGLILLNLNNLDSALPYFEHCLTIRYEAKDSNGIALVSNNLSRLYYDKGDYATAFKYANIAYHISMNSNYQSNLKESSLYLYKIFKTRKDHHKALKYYEQYITIKDEILKDENQRAILREELNYEYEKQKAIDDAEHGKQLAIEQEAKEKQQILTYATAAGLGLTGIFLFFVFNRLNVTRKQKAIIEKQKEVVEEAHQEIKDSITYAKRIQSAILPSAKLVKENLKESFILYKPKDVVAGDFYWMEHKGNKLLFAAADCTGHGVPGAMVSVVCNNALNRSVREYGLSAPGEILTKTREIVVEEFEKSEEDVKDGMDIALCSLEGNKLQYAGAHNPLWIIRNGEIIETKANKQPIGKFDNPEPYTTHSFELELGDSLYLFSDGYVDQFGGEKGKKFKAASFKKLLLSIQDKSMEEQKQIINETYEAWRGNLEQVDDVCIIGVRI